MLSNSEANSNVVPIQQLKQQSNFMHSSEDMLQHIQQYIQSLEKRVKSLEVTNRVILGLLIGTLATAVTVGAGFAIAAAPIIAGSIVGGILATVALAALGTTAYKYRTQITNGFKDAAEKAVEGARDMVHSLKRLAHSTSEKTKAKTSDMLTATADKLYRAAGNENYSDRIDNELVPDSPQKKKTQGVKEDLKEIFVDKGNNSALIKSILSGISSKIEGKIKEKEEVEFTSSTDDFMKDLSLITKWKEDKKFVNKLDVNDLRNLVTKRLSDKDKYFRDRIFSEHHDEIKEVIRESQENDLYSSVSNMFDKAEKKASRPSIKGLFRSISSPSLSLKRKNSEQSRSLSESNSMNSLSSYSTTSSEAELLNPEKHKEVNAPTSFFGKIFSSSKGSKKQEEVTCTGYRSFSEDEIPSAEIENDTFYDALDSTQNENTANISSFSSSRRSSDSGVCSGSSTPQEQDSSVKGLVKKFDASSLKLTGGFKPSSEVTVDTAVQQQAVKMKV